MNGYTDNEEYEKEIRSVIIENCGYWPSHFTNLTALGFFGFLGLVEEFDGRSGTGNS